jgi:hypothetical protein
MIGKKMLGQTILGALLGASLLAGTALPAHADQDERCRRDIQKAEQNLDKAIRKHGEHSRQAEDRRRQLDEVRERCHMRDEHRDDDRRDHR